MNSLIQETEQANKISTRTDIFFNRLGIGQQLSSLKFRKIHGERPVALIKYLIQMIWSGRNWYRLGRMNESEYCKDVVYRFLNSENYNWEGLLYFISGQLIGLRSKLTRKRAKVLIVDDTFFDRSRSKKVQGLSRVHDHTDGKYKKGFCQLMVGWSDGFSFVPLMFRLHSSSKEKNCLCDIGQTQSGSMGEERRIKAKMKKTDTLIQILSKARQMKLSFGYVLMDSWFSFPSLIEKICNLKMDCICMLKRMPKVYYEFEGKKYNLKSLHAHVKKNIKKNEPYTIKVKSTGGRDLNIIFIRDRRDNNWLALLSTDLKIDGTEAVRIYGYRWDIEVCFKICKSYLKLAKEFQGRSYDMITAHTAIVLIRYCMLALALREETDEKTMGDLFYQYGDEVRHRTFLEAIKLLLALLSDFLCGKLMLKKDIVDQAIDEFMAALSFSVFKTALKVCES